MNTYRITNNNWRDKFIRIQLSDKPIFFIHIDTTGLDPKKDEVISIDIIKAVRKDGELVKEPCVYHSFIYTDKTIPHAVFEINGITTAMVRKAPKKDVVIKEVSEFLGEKAILVGFNMPFIGSFIKDFGFSIDFTLDLNTVSRSLFNGNGSYYQLAKEFNSKNPVSIYNGIAHIIPHGILPVTKADISRVNKTANGFTCVVGGIFTISAFKGQDKFGEYKEIRCVDEDFFNVYDVTTMAKL